jgi:hypothetical protein
MSGGHGINNVPVDCTLFTRRYSEATKKDAYNSLCISLTSNIIQIQIDMADRVKKELEEKRAKLVELRRARDERKALLAQAEKGTSEVNPFHCHSEEELMIANLFI